MGRHGSISNINNGPTVGEPMIDLDEFLHVLMCFFDEQCEERVFELETHFKFYDSHSLDSQITQYISNSNSSSSSSVVGGGSNSSSGGGVSNNSKLKYVNTMREEFTPKAQLTHYDE